MGIQIPPIVVFEDDHDEGVWERIFRAFIFFSVVRSYCCGCTAAATGPMGPTGPAGPASITGRLRAIQVELNNAPDGDIVAGAPTLFNAVLNNTMIDVTYTPANGQFLITAPGDYYASWWLATDGTTIDTTINFSVERNNLPLSTATTPVVTGQLSGMAYFTVDTAPAIITLVNTSNDIVQFANTTVQGSMSIIKFSA